MPALFEVELLLQHWGPPFEKKKETSEFRVSETNSFDFVSDRKQEKLFKLVKYTPERALIEYNRLYTLKGYEQPFNRRVWIENGKSVQFSYLWGEHGITKKVSYKGICSEQSEKKNIAFSNEGNGDAKEIVAEKSEN